MPASTSTQSLSDILPGAPLVPVFPGVRPRAQRLALPVAAQHRSGRQIDRGQIHAGGAEQEPRRGLVAAAHQHHAVDGMAAQELLGVHRQHVAVEHGGRLQERFRQRQRRQFQRKAAGHQHAALDVVDAALEVHVAGLRVRPGVEDRDHGAALPLLRRVAHLHGARTMAEGAQIVGGEPARAAQRFRMFLVVWHDPHLFETGQVISQAVCAGQARCWPALAHGSRFQETSPVAANASPSRWASSAWRFDIWFILDGYPSRNSGRRCSQHRSSGAQRWAASPFIRDLIGDELMEPCNYGMRYQITGAGSITGLKQSESLTATQRRTSSAL